jgi:hypothetical protein
MNDGIIYLAERDQGDTEITLSLRKAGFQLQRL